MCSFSPHPSPPSFVSGNPLSLMKARKGICLTTSSSTQTKIRFSLFLKRHSTLFPFYLIWSLSCMDQSFPENFKCTDKAVMSLRKSLKNSKQKMNYFLLKKLESCFLSLYLNFRENRTEICHDLFRLRYETVYLFIFFFNACFSISQNLINCRIIKVL